jgi:myo-inositol-1(or 4)-monophosphatase
VTDWLCVCREATEDVKRVLRELPTRDEREPVLGAGVGGDDTTAIDAAAERVVIECLDRAGADFTLVSEELGVREAREGGDVVVVLDPIDGSINAKRGVPFFALSIAVAEGPVMGDVVFGYVYDFGSGEEWTATRGAGALLNGGPLGPIFPKEQIELLSLEATRTDLVARHVAPFVEIAQRLRIMGSLAISLCHFAAGRVDAVCSLKTARSVDIAAAQLVVRERGLTISLADAGPFEQAPLDLEGRSRVVAAATAERRAELAAALG